MLVMFTLMYGSALQIYHYMSCLWEEGDVEVPCIMLMTKKSGPPCIVFEGREGGLPYIVFVRREGGSLYVMFVGDRVGRYVSFLQGGRVSCHVPCLREEAGTPCVVFVG